MTPQQRRPGRVNLELDGEFWRGASLEAVADLGLRVGMQIDDGERERLSLALEARRAFESALRILAARGRTAGELSERLARKGYSEDAVARAIERCRQLGLIDDRAVLVGRAESLRARGAGRRRAQSELQRLGAEREVLEEVLEEVYPPDSDAELAAASLARKVRPEALADEAGRRRALSWMVRQGHRLEDARAALEQLRPEPAPAAQEFARPERPCIDEDALLGQLRRRYPDAAASAGARQRAWGWAARRGADHDMFRRCLEALAEA